MNRAGQFTSLRQAFAFYFAHPDSAGPGDDRRGDEAIFITGAIVALAILQRTGDRAALMAEIGGWHGEVAARFRGLGRHQA